MSDAVVAALPQLGLSIIFLSMAVYLFRFLMDSNSAFRLYLIERNKYLEDQNKMLIQALYQSRDPDSMRLASALLGRAPPTNLGD